MGGIGIWQLLIVAVIIVLLFGTKKLRNLGSDLGSAVKGFKSAVTDETAKKEFDECIKNKRDNREYPRECPNYDRFGKSPPRNVGGNRRTKRKHKKCKKAKSKRRSIKRRMNK